MSIHQGLTTWIVATRVFTIAYRWNMRFPEAMRTFRILRGRRTVLACGPVDAPAPIVIPEPSAVEGSQARDDRSTFQRHVPTRDPSAAL